MHIIKSMLHRNVSRIAFRSFSDKNSKGVAGEEVKKTHPEARPVASSEARPVASSARLATWPIHSEKDHPDPFENAKSFDKIPGPFSVPFAGTLWSYSWPFNVYSLDTLHLTYEKMYANYGPIVKERQSPNRTLLHLFDPEDIYKVYWADGRRPIRMSHQALGKYRKERPNFYATEGLLSSNGEDWAGFRNLFNCLFSRGHSKEVRSVIEDTVDELLSTLTFRLDGNGELDVMPLFCKWGLESIVRILFNKKLGALQFNIDPNILTLIETAGKTHFAVYMTDIYNTAKYHKMLQKAQDTFSGIVSGLMTECLNHVYEPEYQNCFLSSILHENPSLDRRLIFTMMTDSVLGGIDNTSCVTSMILYHLAQNKRVQDKLREETMENMPTKDIRFTDVIKYKRDYLKAVIRETLRLTPSGFGNGRITSKDLVLSGYLIPAGTSCILQHQVASILEKNYSDAKHFIPERFLERNVVYGLGVAKNASVPFGTGSRSCLGRHIAEEEIRIIVSKIVRNFEISYYHEEVGFTTQLMNKPDKPVRLHFKELKY